MEDKTVMRIGGNKMKKLFLGIFASREHTETTTSSFPCFKVSSDPSK
jgi:1-aminocyclopropane-1-carboxylate deaminase/D-cysteine desulfhydrase-like pyridoxal-dependent ACC family enzyme